MKFFRKLTGTQIFQKITEIAGIKLTSQIQRQSINRQESKPNQQAYQKQAKIENNIKRQDQLILSKKQVKKENLESQNYDLTYQDSQYFIVNLVANVKKINQQIAQIKRKKKIYEELQVEPIYLQTCSEAQILKMQCQIGLFQGAQRAEVLHSYLNQVKSVIKRLLTMSEVSLLQFFQIYSKYSTKLLKIFQHIKEVRKKINKIQIQKYKQIQLIARKKLIIKQKIELLKKMKRKNQFAIVYPNNLDQIYYSQRNRHKMYLKIKNLKIGTQTSFFINLKRQIIEVSKSNVKIIGENFRIWVNNGKISEKQIQKLLICIYFIKSQALYLDNAIDINAQGQTLRKLKPKLQAVKNWKQYRYIRDPAMKNKIIQFLDDLPKKLMLID